MWKVRNTKENATIFFPSPSGKRKENLRIYEADITKIRKIMRSPTHQNELESGDFEKITFWVIGYQIIFYYK
jgi:hypothetical protein